MSSVLGLKVKPSTPTFLPRISPPTAAITLRPMARLRLSLMAIVVFNQTDRAIVILRGLGQRQRILRKARAAIAGSRMQELGADPAIEADAARHVLNIRPDLFAQIGHLVDEGNLHRKKRVGSIFDQFGGASRGKKKRRLVEVERTVDLRHDRRARSSERPTTMRSGRLKSSIAHLRAGIPDSKLPRNPQTGFPRGRSAPLRRRCRPARWTW